MSSTRGQEVSVVRVTGPTEPRRLHLPRNDEICSRVDCGKEAKSLDVVMVCGIAPSLTINTAGRELSPVRWCDREADGVFLGKSGWVQVQRNVSKHGAPLACVDDVAHCVPVDCHGTRFGVAAGDASERKGSGRPVSLKIPRTRSRGQNGSSLPAAAPLSVSADGGVRIESVTPILSPPAAFRDSLTGIESLRRSRESSSVHSHGFAERPCVTDRALELFVSDSDPGNHKGPPSDHAARSRISVAAHADIRVWPRHDGRSRTLARSDSATYEKPTPESMSFETSSRRDSQTLESDDSAVENIRRSRGVIELTQKKGDSSKSSQLRSPPSPTPSSSSSSYSSLSTSSSSSSLPSYAAFPSQLPPISLLHSTKSSPPCSFELSNEFSPFIRTRSSNAGYRDSDMRRSRSYQMMRTESLPSSTFPLTLPEKKCLNKNSGRRPTLEGVKASADDTRRRQGKYLLEAERRESERRAFLREAAKEVRIIADFVSGTRSRAAARSLLYHRSARRPESFSEGINDGSAVSALEYGVCFVGADQRFDRNPLGFPYGDDGFATGELCLRDEYYFGTTKSGKVTGQEYFKGRRGLAQANVRDSESSTGRQETEEKNLSRKGESCDRYSIDFGRHLSAENVVSDFELRSRKTVAFDSTWKPRIRLKEGRFAGSADDLQGEDDVDDLDVGNPQKGAAFRSEWQRPKPTGRLSSPCRQPDPRRRSASLPKYFRSEVSVGQSGSSFKSNRPKKISDIESRYYDAACSLENASSRSPDNALSKFKRIVLTRLRGRGTEATELSGSSGLELGKRAESSESNQDSKMEVRLNSSGPEAGFVKDPTLVRADRSLESTVQRPSNRGRSADDPWRECDSDGNAERAERPHVGKQSPGDWVADRDCTRPQNGRCCRSKVTDSGHLRNCSETTAKKNHRHLTSCSLKCHSEGEKAFALAQPAELFTRRPVKWTLPDNCSSNGFRSLRRPTENHRTINVRPSLRRLHRSSSDPGTFDDTFNSPTPLGVSENCSSPEVASPRDGTYPEHGKGKPSEKVVSETFKVAEPLFAEALWDHVVVEQDELPFAAGDVIRVLDAADRNWWWGRIGEKCGYFPAACVRVRAISAGAAGKDAKNTTALDACLDARRSNVVRELLNTERDFVNCLSNVAEGYMAQCRLRTDLFTSCQITSIFSNLEALLTFQKKFLSDLETRVNFELPHRSCIGETFLAHSSGFQVYSEYCNSHPVAIATLQSLYRSDEYKKFFESCRLGRDYAEIPLDGHLLTPVQRICKYPLQLAELLKCTQPEHPDRGPVQEALETMRKVATVINEKKRKMESLEKLFAWQCRVEGWEGEDLMATSSQLMHQGEVTKASAGFWNNNVTLFLFDHQLVYCKKDLLKRNAFAYKGRVSLDRAEVTDLADGKYQSFGGTIKHGIKIRNRQKDEWLVFCCRSEKEKAKWLEALSDERSFVAQDKRDGLELSPAIRGLARLSAAANTSQAKPKRKQVKEEVGSTGASKSSRKVGAWFVFGAGTPEARHKMAGTTALRHESVGDTLDTDPSSKEP